MKVGNLVLTAISAISLIGCGSVWVKLDGSKASKDMAVAAETDCMVVEKYRELHTKEMTIDLLKIQAETDEAKEELDKVYRNSEKIILSEIEDCMRSKGLRRAQ